MKYIHTLTGLRGLAALLVFISHSANESILPVYFGTGFGQMGVMIFFVLSGFLMSHLYINEDFNSTNVKKYIVARVGRVFPLYFMLLLISLIISNFVYPDFYYQFNAYRLIRAFIFIDAPFVFWTIPVEIQFYMTFLGFWFLYKKHFSPYVLLLFITLTLLPSIFLYLAFSKMPKIVSLYSYAFYIGAVTALTQGYIKNSVIISKIASVAGYPLMILLFINLPVLREQYGLVYSNDLYFKTWGDPVSWIIIYCLFICAILNSRSLAFLNFRPFVYLGNISYGFYLIHYPVMKYFISVQTNPYIQLFLAFVVTIIIAHLSYNYFEKPIGKRIRNLTQTKKR